MEPKTLTPNEVAASLLPISEKKASLSFSQMLILGILAGAYIAFAAGGSNMAAHNLLATPSTYGLGKILSGVVFSGGLAMVLTAGAELFTGNTLMLPGVITERITLLQMLRNWGIVYFANLLGSLVVASGMVYSGLLGSSANLLGAMTIKIAAGKVALPFMQALILGIFCNWLVCLAVWISFSTTSVVGKITGIFFPITLFVTSGFEHSVANMYYIPAGILAASNSNYYQAALQLGVTPAALEQLTWYNFFITNLCPVTVGNIIGGSLFVGMAYFYAYKVK